MDLAERSAVSRQLVSKIERGDVSTVSLGRLRAALGVLGVEAELALNGYGRDLDRLLNAGHAAMHEAAARKLGSLGWAIAPEVSYSVYGERGVIDMLAWHASTCSLLVIELKTSIVDVNDLMGSMDRRRRLAPRIAAERGWRPVLVGSWVAVADTPTNHRRVAAHATVLRAAFPDDGRTVRRWLAGPSGRLDALGFLSRATAGGASPEFRPRRRVDRPSPCAPRGSARPATRDSRRSATGRGI